MPEVKTMCPGVDSEKLETLATSPEQALCNVKSIKTVRALRSDETHFGVLKEVTDRLGLSRVIFNTLSETERYHQTREKQAK